MLEATYESLLRAIRNFTGNCALSEELNSSRMKRLERWHTKHTASSDAEIFFAERFSAAARFVQESPFADATQQLHEIESAMDLPAPCRFH